MNPLKLKFSVMFDVRNHERRCC